MHYMCILIHTLFGRTLGQPQSGPLKLGAGFQLPEGADCGLLIYFLLPRVAQAKARFVEPGGHRTTKLRISIPSKLPFPAYSDTRSSGAG